MKIRIKYHIGSKKLKQNGDWIDLFPRYEYRFNAPKWFQEVTESGNTVNKVEFDTKLIDLGISMRLPKYFEANIVPRSSTFVKQGLIQSNHFGIIDSKPVV